MKVFAGKILLGAMAVTCAGLAYAGPEDLPPPGAGSTEGSVEIVGPAPAAGIPYYEYFHYSAYAKRSYVPGYTPHVTSLFENPRDYPWALCVLATPYYQYAGMPGWFFGSPQGYQSSVPKGSEAAAYYRGELDITTDLRGGYPQVMRVVEPAIVPVGNSSERGGVYIHGGETISVGTAPPETVEIETLEKVVEKTGPPEIVPGPAPAPASLEK